MLEGGSMGKWQFVGTEPRVFGDLSLEVKPDDICEFDEDPPGGELWWKQVSDRRRTTEEKSEG
jgi:hypothetical protein